MGVGIVISSFPMSPGAPGRLLRGCRLSPAYTSGGPRRVTKGVQKMKHRPEVQRSRKSTVLPSFRRRPLVRSGLRVGTETPPHGDQVTL